MSDHLPVRFALLRDGVRWDAVRSGVSPDDAGALRLVRVPGPTAPVRIDLPATVPVSGVAADPCGRVVLTDAGRRSVVMELRECSRRYVLEGGAGAVIVDPAGVAIHGDLLFVADRGRGRVVVLSLPSLEVRRVIDAGLVAPSRLTLDERGRLYVIDSSAKSVRRFSGSGRPDGAFDAAMSGHAVLTNPFDLAWADGHGLLVSDADGDAILGFDANGAELGPLTVLASSTGWKPRCLATHGGLVVVSDAGSGRLVVVDAATWCEIGAIPDWTAPVSSMTFDSCGDLLVTNDGGATYIRLAAGAACVASGSLQAGPLDAGVESNWERVVVDAEVPERARVRLETFVAATALPGPPSSGWSVVPSLDAIFARESGPDTAAPGARRYLWIRASLDAAGARVSPVVRDVSAQTTGASYLDHLPRIYRRDDAKSRFLDRLLALGRSEFEDWDAALDAMHRRLDPLRAPAEGLAWLSSALAFDVPDGVSVEAWRALIARVPDLFVRRGTVAGVRDFAEIATGVRPQVFEAFRARHTWVLCGREADGGARLGIDTALAPAAADGLVVSGHVRTDPSYRGLAGDYYAGFDFDRAVVRRTDRTVDFGGTRSVVPVEDGAPLDRFSIRWSGQIKSRYSETYTFYVTPVAGVRLWVDGVLLIDTWTQSASSAAGPRVTLDSTRWCAITCELHRVDPTHTPDASLEWSSRSEPRGAVPEDCLYSVLDDRADLAPAETETIEVGSAVVGASGPSSTSDFGTAMFADYAHLFTVLVPSASVPGARRDVLRRVIDAEKPAHTDYHLCFADARMRVGFQARLGIDAIVAGGPPPLQLDGTVLGQDSVLSDAPAGGTRVGARARLGRDTVIG